MHHIRIGREGAEFFSLSIRERRHPEATDYWNANWLTCDVEVSAGAFRGVFGAVIRNEDLGRLLRQLRPLYERASGTATLEVSDWLCLDMFADDRNQIEVKCQVDDNRNSLECSLTLDRADLPAVIRQIEEASSAYPVIGQTAAEPGAPRDRGGS
jgi:hypothetical protein